MTIYDLSEIRHVTGLDDSELATVNALIKTWWRKRARNILRNRYYDGHNKLKDLGISIPPSLRNIETYVSWPAKAVDYLADRTILEGFTFNGVDSNKTLDAVVEANDFLTSYSSAVSDALVSSFALISVTKGMAGEPDVLVSVHSARDSSAIWNYRLNRVECALVVADVRRDANGAVKGPSLINVFTPHEVITLGWRANGRWVLEARQKHSQGRPLVEAIRYAPKIGRPLGRSRISRAVMSITDSAVREALRSEVSAEFFTAPQKWIMGAEDDIFSEKTKWETYIGNYLALSVGESGEKPEVGQFPQASMQPHTEYERQLAARFSGTTGIPISSLGVVHDNPSSAEAIYAAKEDIVVAAQNFNRDNAAALRRVAKLMIAVAEDASVNDLKKDLSSIEPRFMNPSLPSLASRTDAVVKQVEAVPEFANSRVFWEMLGYDDAQIARIQSDIARSKASDAVRNLMAPAQESQAENAPPPVADISGKSLNGAQTQSLIAIMSQFSGGKLSEGQAVNLIATSIGISKQDARDLLNGRVD